MIKILTGRATGILVRSQWPHTDPNIMHKYIFISKRLKQYTGTVDGMILCKCSYKWTRIKKSSRQDNVMIKEINESTTYCSISDKGNRHWMAARSTTWCPVVSPPKHSQGSQRKQIFLHCSIKMQNGENDNLLEAAGGKTKLASDYFFCLLNRLYTVFT